MLKELAVLSLLIYPAFAQSEAPEKKPVRVRRYTKKDGTKVDAYHRAEPDTKEPAKKQAAPRKKK